MNMVLTVSFTGMHSERLSRAGTFEISLDITRRLTWLLQRMRSRLWNIEPGEDWKLMCATTPADINGVHFLGPKYCEDGVSLSYIFAMLTVI